MNGTPREIFSQVELLKSYHLDVPQVTLLAHELREAGLSVPEGILSISELIDAMAKISAGNDHTQRANYLKKASLPGRKEKNASDIGKNTDSAFFTVSETDSSEGCISMEHVGYTYSVGTAYEMHALKDVNLTIPLGQFVGVIGHTGSGKSTLIQHFNGLIRPTEGTVRFSGEDIWSEGYSLKNLRSQVGLVFQYPEHQLFETDVLTDVCFGPKNQGLSKEECEARAREALEHVGMGEQFYEKSPFELSGGQKRRVAIAGVLAMNPKVLILDEPTAGLDPQGRDEILEQIALLHRTRGITILLVSHSMEDIAKYVERIIVMNKGVKTYDDTPKNVFSHYKELETIGLAAPQITYIMHALGEAGMAVDVNATTVEEAREAILSAVGKRGAV